MNRTNNDCWVNETAIEVAAVVQRGVADLTVQVDSVQTAVDALADIDGLATSASVAAAQESINNLATAESLASLQVSVNTMAGNLKTCLERRLGGGSAPEDSDPQIGCPEGEGKPQGNVGCTPCASHKFSPEDSDSCETCAEGFLLLGGSSN